MPRTGQLEILFYFALVCFDVLKNKVLAFRINSPHHCRSIYQIPKGWRLNNNQHLVANSARKRGASVKMVTKSGGIKITSVEGFDLVLQNKSSEKPIQLVFFTAAWCGPCRLTVPVVTDIMKQFQSQLDVYEVNTDDLADVAENCEVVSIPTIQLYHKGKVKDTLVGCVAKNVLAASLTKLLEDVVPSSDQGSGHDQK